MTKPEVRTLTDSVALSALAHPFRARMMDALKVDGPATASMIAARTGQAVGNASHHLKVLAEAGLVEEAPELARDKRERWWRLVDAGTRWSRREFAGDAVAVAAAEEAEALTFQRQVQRTRDWLANSGSDPHWDDAAYATQHWLRLTPEELHEVAAEVIGVFQRWGERTIPDDGLEREPTYLFSRGFPSRP